MALRSRLREATRDGSTVFLFPGPTRGNASPGAAILECVLSLPSGSRGKAGVAWYSQGSGRDLSANWTFGLGRHRRGKEITAFGAGLHQSDTGVSLPGVAVWRANHCSKRGQHGGVFLLAVTSLQPVGTSCVHSAWPVAAFCGAARAQGPHLQQSEKIR